MAKEVLENGNTYLDIRSKINSNFTELYNLLNYNSYKAWFSQSGTANPTVDNEISVGISPISILYVTVGKFVVNFDGIIPPEKLDVVISQKGTTSKDLQITWVYTTSGSNTQIRINVFSRTDNAFADNVLNNTPITFIVYP